jgi:uncharacterized protein
MRRETIVKKTQDFLEKRSSGESTGHDFWHSLRVMRLAARIGKQERADLFVVRLAALLHDIADWKFHAGDVEKGPRIAGRFLAKLGVGKETCEKVADIIRDISFKGAGVKDKPLCLEGRVVRDADRLDALGAVGIARTFAYGGSKGNEIHNPGIKPLRHASFKAYRKSKGTTINHFYEKLLLLKDRMQTRSGKRMARERHAFMKRFLARFLYEWNLRK